MDPVIVAGAGPVGLALSLALAAQGVPSVVLDEGTGTDDPRPARTAILRPDTAALMARLGCTTLGDEGAHWIGWRLMRRKQLMRELPLGEDAPAPCTSLSTPFRAGCGAPSPARSWCAWSPATGSTRWSRTPAESPCTPAVPGRPGGAAAIWWGATARGPRSASCSASVSPGVRRWSGMPSPHSAPSCPGRARRCCTGSRPGPAAARRCPPGRLPTVCGGSTGCCPPVASWSRPTRW